MKNKNINRNRLFWILQAAIWSIVSAGFVKLYYIISGYYFSFQITPIYGGLLAVLFFTLPFASTSFIRFLLRKYRSGKKNILPLIILMVVACFVLGVISNLPIILVNHFLFGQITKAQEWMQNRVLIGTLNFFILYLVWMLFYFVFSKYFITVGNTSEYSIKKSLNSLKAEQRTVQDRNANRRLLFWTLQIAGWCLYCFTQLFTQVKLSETYSWRGTVLDTMEYVLTGSLIGLVGTSLIRQIIHLIKNKIRHEVMIFFLIGIVVPVMALISSAIQKVITPLPVKEILFNDPRAFHHILVNGTSFLIVYGIWVVLYFVITQYLSGVEAQIKTQEQEKQQISDKFEQLKTQINPHFLFNSLNSIRGLIAESSEQAMNALDHLSLLLRNSLNSAIQETISLREEVDHVMNYLSLEELRFEDRLKIEKEIDEKLLEEQVPPFSLQTLVENAIKHGISRLKGGGTIHILIDRHDKQLRMVVENRGQLSEMNVSGIGLNNLKRRIEIIYGKEAIFNLKSSVNGNVTATLELPLLKNKNAIVFN